MAITYPLSLPAGTPTRLFRPMMKDTVGIASSPYTGGSQKFVWPYNRWTAEMQFREGMTRAQAAPLIALLGQLRGQQGTILIGDPDGRVPQGDPGDGPIVCDGATAAGSTTLTVRGFFPSRVGSLLAMDYLQLGTGLTQRLYANLTDVTADGSGHATLDIWPVLREATVDGQVLTLTDAKGCFRLAGDERGWELDKALRYGVTLSLVEDI